MSELDGLRQECLNCRRCEIGGRKIEGCLSNVFSNMNPDAKVMVVGQNPGRQEVEEGEPFVGASGKFFDEAVKGVLGLGRSDFYISNIVRCFTPQNRPPSVREVSNCRAFLDREIEIVKPVVMIVLGSPSFKQITGMSGITKHHGRVVFSPRYGVQVMPLFHPSPYNTNNPERRRIFYEDLEKLGEILDEARSDSGR